MELFSFLKTKTSKRFFRYIIGLTNPSKKKAAKSKVLSLMKEIKSRLED